MSRIKLIAILLIMTKYVAFLRGINSGQNPSQKMENLRKIFEGLGFENVKSFIASGNIIFDVQKTERNGILSRGYIRF